jgi:hypothetical protein
MLNRTWAASLFAVVVFQVSAEATPPGTEFPFEFRDGLIWVQVQLRGSPKPLNFLLDSGAGVSVINLPTLVQIQNLKGRRITVHGVGTTTTGYWPQHLSTEGTGLPLTGCFLAVDLTDLGRACHRTVDGLVGADFFRNHVVQIDFAANRIRLSPSIEPGANRIELPLDAQRGALCVPIRINNGDLQWVRLDTGCASDLHWVSGAVPPEACKPQVSVALTTLTIPMTRAAVQIGGAKFDDVPAGLHERTIFPGEAGLLGNGLLSRFRSVTVDVHSARVFLESSGVVADKDVRAPLSQAGSTRAASRHSETSPPGEPL